MTRNVAFLTAVVFLAACQDRTPTAPSNAISDWRAATGNRTANTTAPACVPLSLAALNAEVNAVFTGLTPDANSVKSKIDQIDKALKKNDTKKAQEHAFNAVRFVFQKFKGPKPLAGGGPAVGSLISHIFCFAGINITVTDPANANVVDPANTTQTVTSSDSSAGTQLPPGSITEPTVLEFKKVPNIYEDSAPGRGPLNTRLDQYPGFFLITAGSASGSGPAAPVVVAICPDATVPAWVRARLRLGHETSGGFEIAPPADGSFLKCPAPAAVGFLPGWMNKALGVLLPRTLYAAEEEFRGVGGLASEFSPFDPVDSELSFDRGVGGLATEFKRSGAGKATLPFAPATQSPTGSVGVLAVPGLNASLLATCAAVEAPWSTQLAPECRPGIIIRTRLGTAMQNVPVLWTIDAGGGRIAVEQAGPVCSTFGSSAATTTDLDGRSGACWEMGPTPGANAASATPSTGGDAEAGVVFVPTTHLFSATAIKATPKVNVYCPLVTVTYNGGNQTPCNATAYDSVHTPVSSLGPVPVTYGPTTPPHDAGSYTADASYVETALYFGVNAAQKTFQIAKATPTVNLTCTTPVYYTGADQSPCSATATGVVADGVLSPAPVVTYVPTPPNAPGNYTATATFAVTLNYTSALASAPFDIVGFFDGFEAPSAWTASGFWNRNTLTGIINQAYVGNFVHLALGDGSGGALPSPFPGGWASWYGEPATGSYVGTATPGGGTFGGGTSPSRNFGTLTSPDIAISADIGQVPTLRFDSWFEIEAVQPHEFDLMKVSVVIVASGDSTALGMLNPGTNPSGGTANKAIPFTSGGFNAPPVWIAVAKDLSAFRGLVVRFRFTFDTGDPLYNGYRGWIVDNVRVTSAPVMAAVATRRAAQPGTRPTRDLNPVPPDAPVRLP